MNVHAMSIVIKFSFWLALIGVVLGAILIPTSSYPRTVEHSLGEDVFKLLISGGACVVYAWMLGWFA